MKRKPLYASVAIIALSMPVLFGQNADPAVQPAADGQQAQPGAPARGGAARGGGGSAAPLSRITPTAEQVDGIRSKITLLESAIEELKLLKVDDALIVEAEVAAHYAKLTLRFPEEFFDQQVVGRCMSVLDSGIQRAAELKLGQPNWVDAKGRVSRAFRSRVDGTPQPYRVVIPSTYDKSKPTPLYIYLHGRGDTDLGLGWIGGQSRAANGEIAGGSRGPIYIQLQVFGRANNSFRYAGEADVLEAIDTVQKNYNIDPDRIVLAGFSMGGAGSWQIGLHNPDMFCGLEIDAGVIGNRRSMEDLTLPQKAANALYGIMIDHAVNVLHAPLVGYAGEHDAQLAASTSIREQLIREGFTIEHPSPFVWKATDIRALFLANPRQGHSHASGETLQMINEFTTENFRRSRVVPDHVRFVTYTTRYNKNYWVTVDGMQQHFERASIDATRDVRKANYTIKTSNVSRLLLNDTAAAESILIDGETITVKPAATLLLTQNSGHWQLTDSFSGGELRKKHNSQGPINDAFLNAFLCVTPGGPSDNPMLDERNKQELERFDRVMAKEYRGAARAKADSTITPQDIADNNLVLFGDPRSNKILAQIADKLPITWGKESVTIGAKSYSTFDSVPVLIYPNPLNPNRYVVINTGLVAAGSGVAAGYGDFAVLKMTKSEAGVISTQVVENGVFDESWKVMIQK